MLLTSTAPLSKSTAHQSKVISQRSKVEGHLKWHMVNQRVNQYAPFSGNVLNQATLVISDLSPSAKWPWPLRKVNEFIAQSLIRNLESNTLDLNTVTWITTRSLRDSLPQRGSNLWSETINISCCRTEGGEELEERRRVWRADKGLLAQMLPRQLNYARIIFERTETQKDRDTQR